jgi:hypothetical protein
MSFVEPARPRYRTEETFDGLEISIPAKRMWFAAGFLGFWLMGWLAGEVAVTAILVVGLINVIQNGLALIPQGPVGLFLLGWLGAWTVGGLAAMRAWLWSMGGREVVTVGRISLRIEHRAPFWSRRKEYNMADVADLRLSQQPAWPWGRAAPFPMGGDHGGTLAFDYGAGTVRFGTGLEEAEAKGILREIGGRCPGIMQQDAGTGDRG